MVLKRTLFDHVQHSDQSKERGKEAMALERLKNLEDKITTAIERVKALKEEKAVMQRRLREFEDLLNVKNLEIEQLRSERDSVREQIEGLLTELEMIESD
jgi:FtsZ-binding cell division protein ZapB